MSKDRGPKKKEKLRVSFAYCPTCDTSKSGEHEAVASFALTHALRHTREGQRVPVQVAA